MRFKRGYLGVLLVTLCLFGSALACIILNVDSEDVTTTKYDYVTDVSGLFDYSDAPQYTEYNPIKNYTGYSNTITAADSPSGISFTSSNAASNYTILTRPATTTASISGTINNNTNLPQATFSSSPVISLSASDPAVINSTSVTARLYGFKVTTMYDWLSNVWPNFETYQAIGLNFTFPGGAPNGNVLFCNGSYTHPGTGELTLSVIGSRSNAVQSATVDPSNYTATFSLILSNGMPSTRTVSLYETWICYGNASQRENYFITTGGQIGAGESYYNTTMSLTYTSTVTSGAEYGYLIPSAGVTLAAGGSNGYYSTDWNNGETNGIINLVFDGWNNTNSNPAAIAIEFGIGNDNYTVNLTKSDAWTVGVNQSVETLGGFGRIMVTLDTIDGKLTIRPVQFTNFTTFEVIDTILYDTDIEKGAGIAGLRFSPVTYAPLRWSVANTTVLMNTYGAVMVDPSIDINDYWPNMEHYRLWFQSFALYGDSITLNGVTYPVDEFGDVEINGQTYDLNNFYVSYPIDGNVYITFVLGDDTVDLGEKVTDVISFGGTWYFTTGLYEGVQTTEKVYNWAVGWNASPDQFILISLGLLAAGVVVVRKTRGLTMGVLDWMAVIIAVIGLAGFLGGF